MLSKSTFFKIALVLLTSASNINIVTAQAASQFPAHAFTIRKPEPCDANCQASLCSIEDYCKPCGSGQCTGREECGTWAGKADHCCTQPYVHEGPLLCSDVSSFLSTLDVSSAAAGSKGTVITAEQCPSGQVVAAYSAFGENKNGNLTCCSAGMDAVILESEGILSVPEEVLCIDEVSGSTSSGSGSSSSGGGGSSDSGSSAGGASTNAAGKAYSPMVGTISVLLFGVSTYILI
ncbi:hypothetical protein ABW21_db0207831 [Orbilia brochopaga]|nr:hypothetical protein ABW21_db0207831 [Drechslerella brochopaga]